MSKTEERDKLLSLSTRSDKLGNIYHVVSYPAPNGLEDYACFKHLSSALDFINSNFK